MITVFCDSKTCDRNKDQNCDRPHIILINGRCMHYPKGEKNLLNINTSCVIKQTWDELFDTVRTNVTESNSKYNELEDMLDEIWDCIDNNINIPIEIRIQILKKG